MIQGIVVILLVVMALAFLGRKFYREYSGNGTHCDDCTVSDLKHPSPGKKS